MITATVAQEIHHLAGPCRILHYGCTDPLLVEALLLTGCDAYGQVLQGTLPNTCASHRFVLPSDLGAPGPACEVVVVDPALVAHATDCATLLRQCRLLCRRLVVLWADEVSGLPRPIIDDREAWERAAIEAGFRRHLSSWSRDHVSRSRSRRLDRITCFESIEDHALATGPMEQLLRERALHMDMSRETGARADAHLARYALACEWIRRGDTVLDCACGLGYGTALMASRSFGHHFIGADISETAIRYAQAHFCRSEVDYRVAQAEQLAFLAESSVDFIASFETLEHLANYAAFLNEAERVLKPDGRIIVSVPNMWVDESGVDPNPHHHHAFDYRTLKAALEKHFVIEARYAQTAPGGFKLPGAPPSLEQRCVDVQADEEDTEWWVVVASANPLRKCGGSYHHPEFERSALPPPFHLTDFGAHYRNPWLYRHLIQQGERLRDPEILIARLEAVLAEADPASADYGAALTVRGYRLLEAPIVVPEAVDAVLAKCDHYLALPGLQPHQARWQTSIAYLAAQLSLRQGRRSNALGYLQRAQAFDPAAFSPLIATKCTAAAYLHGMISLADGQTDLAREAFLSGIRIARQALQSTDDNAIGNPQAPLTFGFQELSDIAETAGRCALALRYIDQFSRDPGRFYRLVSPRRRWHETTSAAGGEEASRAAPELATLRTIGKLMQQVRRESTPLRRLINRLLSMLLGVRLVKEHMLDKIANEVTPYIDRQSPTRSLRHNQ